MRRSLTKIAGATSLLLSAALTVMPAARATTVLPTWDHGAGGERYVAFGDSFVAGPGIAPQRDPACGRSENNFPSLVAERLRVRAFTDASCGGARTVDYWNTQASSGNPAQLEAVGPDTTFVTLGMMGGNDVGLVALATSCILATCAGTPGDLRHQAVDALVPSFARIIDDVRAAAPRATIMAIGYGTYLPTTPCAGLPGVTAAEASYLQGLIDHLSDTIEAVAEAKGVLFADMRDIPGSLDHTPCAAPDQQWIRGLATHGDGAPLHPTTVGMEVMAEQVLTTLRHSPGSRVALGRAAAGLKPGAP